MHYSNIAQYKKYCEDIKDRKIYLFPINKAFTGTYRTINNTYFVKHQLSNKINNINKKQNIERLVKLPKRREDYKNEILSKKYILKLKNYIN